MTLLNLVLFFILLLVCMLFWQSRGIAEAAMKHVKQYCDKNGLQVISVSLQKRKIALVQGKPGWNSTYQFEFSGNKEDTYTGNIVLLNKHAKHIDVPAYKVE
ncbi:DUF3301 domain-containing protein [Alteromonas sp. 5E99-2]|uniref:DUF3301 domain-containing protein n=1 Tax=Alteromonas sp. 5E99-2 TaxID=2817683 RepID=UPI001A98871F|nr:DUF3301 domain-containing protein [Alteromonas sp. 5E99-2]